MMKKNYLQSILLIVCTCLSLSMFACGNKPNESPSQEASTQKEPSSPTDEQEEQKTATPPLTAKQICTIAKHVIDMPDPDDKQAVEAYLTQQLSNLGLERLPYEISGLHFYGRDVKIKEVDSGFIYDFTSKDGFVIQIGVIENVFVETSFKDKKWISYYEKAFKDLSYIKMPRFEEGGIIYAEHDGLDDVVIDPVGDNGVFSVVYNCNYFEEFAAVSSIDAANMMGKPYGEAKELAEVRCYTLVEEDFDDDGDGDAYLSETCNLKPDESCDIGFELISTGEDYESYSAIKLEMEKSIVKRITLDLRKFYSDQYLEDLIHAGYIPVKSTSNSRTLKNKDGNIAVITIHDEQILVVIEAAK